MKDKQDLHNLTIDKSLKLDGFKVAGVLPFHLKYIRVATHIKLLAILDKIKAVKVGEPDISDFYNKDLQAKLHPLMVDYCTTGLLNSRFFGFLLKPFIRAKIRNCGHAHLLNLYMSIHQLNEPAFFFTYWKFLRKSGENTKSSAEKPS